MSLQSRFVGCGEGESGERLSCGDTLPLVKRTADAKLERTSLSTGGLPCPLRNLFSFLPRQFVDGTEDSGKVVAPSAGFRADCLFRQVRGRYCRGHYVVVNLLPYEGIPGWIRRKIKSTRKCSGSDNTTPLKE